MTDETVFWIAWLAMMAALPANLLLMWLGDRREKRIRETARYVCKANRDFAEAAALLKYGAIDEAVELLSKYDRERA